MKKLIMALSTLLVLALLFTAVGCGDDDDEDTTPTQAPTATSETTATATPEPAGYTGGEHTFKFSHGSAVDSYTGQVWDYMDERLQYYTDGQVKFEMFPMSSLYSFYESWDAVATGAIDITPLSETNAMMQGLTDFMISFLGHWWGESGDIDSIYDHGKRFLEHPDGYPKLLLQLEARGIKPLTVVPGSYIIVNLTKDDPIENISTGGSEGLKCRGVGGILDILLVECYGWVPVQLDTPEVNMAFELGLIDNLGTGLEAALSQRQYEPAKYVYMQQGCLITNSFPSMNLELWNSLSPELQDIFMNKVGPEVYEFAWDLIVKTDLNAKEELESLGLIFSEMTDEDRELARDCVWNSPTLATYLAMMDPDIVALADALRSEPYDEAPHYPDWSP